ncbi:MAG TPA: HEAT repeat domain-containing protein [Planctomycetota bacterium]
MLIIFALFLSPALPLYQEPPLPDDKTKEVEEVEEADKPEVAPIDPAAAEKAVREVLENGEREAIVAIFEKEGRVADKSVVKALAGGLKHADSEVRIATLRALRFNEDPAALTTLLGQAKNKKLLEDPKAAIEFYMGLGQKADKKAVPVIGKGLKIDDGGDRVMMARIAALGRIRDKASVEELLSFQVAGNARRAHPYQKHINVALAVLTGAEMGSRDHWQSWWNDNKNSFEVAADLPELPEQIKRAWGKIWSDESLEGVRGKRDKAKEGRERKRGAG